jgi:peptidoglycan/xylan/chitin deacetylase (PgdA/CDA1 family)
MGIITIAFDDGYKTTCEHTARFLKDKGIRATYAIPSALIGDLLEGRPVAENDHLFALDHMGHEIASHGVTHRNLLDVSLKDGPDAAEKEMSGSQLQIGAIVGKTISSFVFPYIEASSTRYLRHLASRHYSSCRVTTESFAFNPLPVNDPFCVMGTALTTDIPIERCNRLADIAAANDFWLVEVFHLVSDRNTKSAHRDAPYRFFTHVDDFKRHIDHILKLNIPILTQGEAVERFKIPA